MASPETDAAIAQAWPERWIRAVTSQKRTKLRKAWRLHQEYLAFRQNNPTASCASCKNRAQASYRSVPHCLADSDFYGDTLITDESAVCTYWKPR